jgi:hypothetical protein
MAKQVNTVQEPKALTFDEKLTASNLPDDMITGIRLYANEEKSEALGLDVMDLCTMGLSLKEAIIVVKHRNSRSVNVSLRMSQREVDQLDEVEKALQTRGYIQGGRTDAIMFMILHFDIPEDRQQVIEL